MESAVLESAFNVEIAQERQTARSNLTVDDLHRGPEIGVGDRARDRNVPLDGAFNIAHSLRQPSHPAGVEGAESALE